jgi:hypothetical protein
MHSLAKNAISSKRKRGGLAADSRPIDNEMVKDIYDCRDTDGKGTPGDASLYNGERNDGQIPNEISNNADSGTRPPARSASSESSLRRTNGYIKTMQEQDNIITDLSQMITDLVVRITSNRARSSI